MDYEEYSILKRLPEMYESYRIDELKKFVKSIKTIAERMNFISTSLFDSSHWNNSPTRKADLIAWIIKTIQNEKFLRALYEYMSPLEQAVVQEVVHHRHNQYDAFQFRAKYRDTPAFATSEEYKSLSFIIPDGSIMPKEIFQTMEEFVPLPEKAKPRYFEEIPESVPTAYEEKSYTLTQHNTEQAALNDIIAVLQLIDTGKVQVSSSTGKVSKSGAKAIREILLQGDYYPEDLETPNKYDVQIGSQGIRPFAWGMLLQASNLAKPNGTKLELTRMGRSALKKPPHETLSKIWERWLKTKIMHELNRVDVIKGQKSKKRPLAAAEPCRQQIAETLTLLDSGRWIETLDFFDFLIAAGQDFEAVRYPWFLYIDDPNYGHLGYSHISWSHLNGRFGFVFLLEYAATLGLVDVLLTPPWGAAIDISNLWGIGESYSCLSRYDGMYAFRLNSLGAWILGKQKKYTPKIFDQRSLHVLPNLEITLTAEQSASADTLFLDRFCQDVSERVWRLDNTKILQSVEEGISLHQIIEFLTKRAEGEIPENVRIFFDDISKRVDKVKDVGEARLVECADKHIALLISHDARLKNICFLAGERYLAVPKENEQKFRKALRELGYVMGS